jgi:tetratricopeptide (TPR) repeat protein
MNMRDFVRFFASDVSSLSKRGGVPSPEYRRELRDVRLAIEVDEDFDKAIHLAEPFFESTDLELSRQAKKFVASCRFRKGEYDRAQSQFESLAVRSEDSEDWFNLAMAATAAGNVDLGELAFKEVITCQHASNYTQKPTLPFMRVWYAGALRDRKEFLKALQQIEELRGLYEQLHVTDTQYLYNRGVPSLSLTMSIALDVLRGLGDSFDSLTWIRSFAPKLDDDGRSLVYESWSNVGHRD